MTEVKVTHGQVESARALVEIAGGIENVDPVIAAIATADPAESATPTAPEH